MPNVFAAVFHPNTLIELATKSHEQRMMQMKTAIVQAHGILGAYAGMMKAADAFFIFVAPEYSFVKAETNTSGLQVWTLHSEAEKKSILDELRTLSGHYKRFLIAPGSIAWFKPKKTAVGARTKDGWNTAPIFFEGKVLHEYDKIYDDGNFGLRTSDVAFQKGTKSQLFKAESMRFGIEVCGDFDCGNLGGEAKPESLDFELMLSAPNHHEFNELGIVKIPVRNGGYFIHSDCNKPQYCGAWCLNRGSGSHGTVVPSSLRGGLLIDPWTGKVVAGDKLGTTLAAGTVLMLNFARSQSSGTYAKSTPAPVQNAGRPRAASAPMLGMNRATAAPAPVQPLPAMRFPQQPAPATTPTPFGLRIAAKVVAPFLSSTNDSYRIEATATLTEGASGAALGNQQIVFTAANGTVANGVQVTNGQGVATAVFTGRKGGGVLQMSASFNGVSVEAEAQLQTLSGGNVSRMSRLQPETVSNMRSYHLPI